MPSRKAISSLVVYIDGASRGNPGPAAYAVVVEEVSGSPVTSFSKFLGEATNNVAEYEALLAALQYALESGSSRLRVLTDSELMARQIQGAYKVRSADLRPLYDEARGMIARLERFSISHIPREQNRKADRLANQALDRVKAGGSIEPAPPAPSPSPSKPVKASAVYRHGALELQRELPLTEGEVVELEIRRKP